ncbi:receptor-type guanylate cyclase gcy-2-like [Paramacrobiotus metropolitanus]|uniref:receptor-type guanylate cyclase gcy-2-like n=1 Tax=Paramacrobiotus metropolitanus TaxID=2943436 RepID=UPI0024462B41|nr:receptor-type guanylate cyclase gcy-2-like [Paramacrobiotus metropolitanus]
MHRLANENIGRFYGIILDDISASSYLMCEFTQRGSLYDVVTQKNILSDMPIRISFLHDLIKGLNYIHNSPLHCHGSLSAQVCFINSRFTLKVSHAGYQKIFSLMSNDTNVSAGSRAVDIVSFGKICNDVLSDADSAAMAKQSKLSALIDDCLSLYPAQRPNCQKILRIFRTLPSVPRNVVSHTLSLLDRQTVELEESVRIKTADLLEEMRKTDILLSEILPKTIIQRLRNKEQIAAEAFDSVSILFSDIPEFAELLRRCTPIELINLLNDAHSKFDGVLMEFDAYKVETVGDCYMISSGVPIRNDKHAAELCFLAHTLLKTSHSFHVASAQDVTLTARIGINSGNLTLQKLHAVKSDIDALGV